MGADYLPVWLMGCFLTRRCVPSWSSKTSCLGWTCRLIRAEHGSVSSEPLMIAHAAGITHTWGVLGMLLQYVSFAVPCMPSCAGTCHICVTMPVPTCFAA